MTLVDAHRAARRDSPVLPVRIFPVGLSRPRSGASGPARGPTRRRPPGRVRTGLSLTAGQIPGAPPVGSSDGVPISLTIVLGHNPLPSRPRTLTEQALWKPVIEQISTFKAAPK